MIYERSSGLRRKLLIPTALILVTFSMTGCAVNDMAVSVMTQNEANLATPLYEACRTGDVETIEELLKDGADAGETTYGREYPLEVYLNESYSASVEVVSDLIEHGADVNEYYLTPSVIALMQHYGRAEKEYQEIIERELEILIENDCKWQNTDNSTAYAGFSLIHFAAASDNTDFLERLLEDQRGMELIDSVTEDGYTPLHLAAMNGRTGNYEYLIQMGADTAIKDNTGKTAEEYLYLIY